MRTLTLKGEVGPDSTLHLEVPSDIPPGPVEVTVRSLTTPDEPREDLWTFLLRARAEIEAAGSHFMNDEEVQAHIEDLRSGDERWDEIHRQIDDERRRESGA
jgi:hypothetical protein